MLSSLRMLWGDRDWCLSAIGSSQLTTEANVSGKCTDKWPTGGVWKSESCGWPADSGHTLFHGWLARVDCLALSVCGLTLGPGEECL